MNRDVIYSVFLHLGIVLLVLLSSPFSPQTQPFDYGEVIKIKAVSIPPSVEQKTVAPISVPKALPEEKVDIPIDEPTSIKEEVKIEQPKPKKEQSTITQKNESTGSSTGDDNKIETSNTDTGSPFAGATVDNASFDYPYWFVQTFNKINFNFKKTVPLDGSVICVVYFQVIRSGRIIDINIKQSSGIDAVDRDCIAAIERSAPFPPLPREFRDEIIGITVPIKY
jgi:TonB family protein